MRRLALLCVLALAACDDPAVQSKVVAVLEHGTVAAAARCSETASSADLEYRVEMMIDGSVHATLRIVPNWGFASAFCERNEACAADGYVNIDGGTYWSRFVDGDWVFNPGTTQQALDIETYCTGFNLEAFGVE